MVNNNIFNLYILKSLAEVQLFEELTAQHSDFKGSFLEEEGGTEGSKVSMHLGS